MSDANRWPDAASVITELGLQRHPEGGWYRETWRGPCPEGGRSTATTILYLLECGQRSHWHRVDASEIWLYHAGAAMLLETAQDATVLRRRVGPRPADGEVFQAV